MKSLARMFLASVSILLGTMPLWAADATPSPTPEESLQRLADGNARYASGKPTHPDQSMERRTETAAGQHPFAIVLTCSDSRVPAEVLYDQGIGNIFTVRVAGNAAGADEIGSIEYAVEHLHAPLIVVLGHSKCGAVAAALKPGEFPRNLSRLIDKVTPAAEETKKDNPTLTGDALQAAAVKANVYHSMKNLLVESPVVAEFVKAGKVKLVGGVYDLTSGSVNVLGEYPEQAALLANEKATEKAGQEGETHATTATPTAEHTAKPAANVAEPVTTATNAPTSAVAAPVTQASNNTMLIGVAVAGLLGLFTGGVWLLLNSVGKKFTIGQRLGVGFSALVLLACGLGGLAVWNFRAVKADTTAINEKYAPELTVVTALNQALQNTQLQVRDYSYSANPKSLEKSRVYLADIGHHIEEGKALCEKYPDLVKLKTEIGELDKAYSEYGAMVDQTAGMTAQIAHDRETMNQAAGEFTNAYNVIAASQERQLQSEISGDASAAKLRQRMAKVNLLNRILRLNNLARIAAFKSQALRDPKIVQTALDDFAEMDKHFAELDPLVHNPQDRKELADLQTASQAYRKAMSESVATQVAQAELTQRRAAAGAKISEIADNLQAAAEARMAQANKETLNSVAMSTTVLIVGSIGAIVSGVLLAVVLGRMIARALAAIAETLASGAHQTATAASQVSSASQSMAQGASEQAAALEQTTSALEEMSSMTRQNAETAQKASAISMEAQTAAVGGNKAMTRMISAIEEIQKTATETAKIIKVIDEIAFQTNLLALNAAVEAARAGEAGKGFAVVAEEVRNLAMRSAEAAKNTASMIENSVGSAKNGVEISQEVAKRLSEITNAATSVHKLVGEIAAASNEQARGIDQVNKAVGEMDKVTQASAANAEESASAAEELASQAQQVSGVVGNLQVLVGASSSK